MSSGARGTIAVDRTQAQPDEAAVRAALAVLDHFMAALHAGDEPALLATLHFPHYRLAGGTMRVIATTELPHSIGSKEKRNAGWRPCAHDGCRVHGSSDLHQDRRAASAPSARQ